MNQATGEPTEVGLLMLEDGDVEVSEHEEVLLTHWSEDRATRFFRSSGHVMHDGRHFREEAENLIVKVVMRMMGELAREIVGYGPNDERLRSTVQTRS